MSQATEKESEFKGIFGAAMPQSITSKKAESAGISNAGSPKSTGISSAEGIPKSTAISGGTEMVVGATVISRQSLENAFNPQLSVDNDSPRRSRRRYTAGNISRNIKGGWRQTKSMGRSIARSVSPQRWRKSDQQSLVEQDCSLDSEISDSTTEEQELHPSKRRRTFSWSGPFPHDIEKKDEAATDDTESPILHMKQQPTLTQPLKHMLCEKHN